MAEIVWSDEALSDLEAIGEYFERTSPQYASAVVSRLYSSVERLVEYPKMGRKVPEVERESLRELTDP
jgi:toxin ParE1/3/4